LFRHYWILIKLLMNASKHCPARPHGDRFSLVARVAAETTLSSADLRDARIQLVVTAGAAVLLLCSSQRRCRCTNPRGRTRYGQRMLAPRTMGRNKLIDDDELLRVAREIFREGGPTATTRNIASAAGISQAALYQRFGRKKIYSSVR